MNPFITIWTSTAKTIDYLKSSNWGEGYGLLLFTLLAINSGAAKFALSLNVGVIPTILITIVIGFVIGILVSFIWTNIIYFAGKLWKGKSTREDVKTVLSLGLMPEIFRFINFVASAIVHNGHLDEVVINDALSLICIFLGFRIVIIGLSRVQQFSYGLAILNIFVPQILITALYLIIKGG